MISTEYFLHQQRKIQTSKAYGSFVVFWAFYSVLLILILGLHLASRKDYKLILLAAAAFILGRFIISPLIYVFYKKPRPYQRFKFTPPSSRLFSLLTQRLNAFPADHPVSFASVGLVIFYYYPFLGGLIFLTGLVASWARVALGFHDFFDVLGGWVVGISAAILTLYLAGRFW